MEREFQNRCVSVPNLKFARLPVPARCEPQIQKARETHGFAVFAQGCRTGFRIRTRCIDSDGQRFAE
jgi:hypothetical protein